MKRSQIILAIGLLCLFTLTALAMGKKHKQVQPAAPAAATVTQGIKGRVEIWQGDFMPMVEPAKRSGQITPGAGRLIRVHEPVKAGGMANAKMDSIPTPMVAETVCDSLGQFIVAVEPGTYSIFVEEGKGWYFNGWDGSGIQGAVTVDSGKVSDVMIKITTKATF